ncbi:MAG TPA: alanine/ornithine racemase family PLP-dependent enzyme [Acidimicrobiales bacterium]|nr:alanine/ornithine racemase family PLP-dependent enzyme [Acidimicrobiales bacterium]
MPAPRPTPAPRLDIDLGKVHHNARTLVEALGARGISVTGVTKAALGSPEIARTLLRAGVRALGDSRVENLEGLRRAGVTAPLVLVRSPMPSQVDRVVRAADVSLNTERAVVRALSGAAQAAGREHGIVLMVELGDLREGLLPTELEAAAREVLQLPHLVLRGIGTNLACQSGVVPDPANMGELSALARAVEAACGVTLDVVSGGNSANLGWALSGADPGRVDDLRLGEAILLGREPLHRRPLDGLHADAFTLVAEVIEAKVKPSQPRGERAQAAFGPVPAHPGTGSADGDSGAGRSDGTGPEGRDGDEVGPRVIVALGHQDTDPAGLLPPPGVTVLGASSDHLVLDPGRHTLAVGDEVPFQVGYGALVRAMTSPFVTQVLTGGVEVPPAATSGARPA